MSIKVPLWCKDAIPTPRGWTCARTGELLKSQKIPAHVVDAYNKVEEVIVPVVGAPVVYEDVSEEVIANEEFKAIDLNSDGKITEVEFVEYKATATKPKKKKKHSLIKRMFKSDK